MLLTSSYKVFEKQWSTKPPLFIFRLFRMKPQCLKDIMNPLPPNYEDSMKTEKLSSPYAQIGDTNHYPSMTCIKDNNYNKGYDEILFDKNQTEGYDVIPFDKNQTYEGYDEIPFDKNQTVPEDKLYFQNIATMPVSNQIIQENRMYLQNPITVPLDNSEKPKFFQ